MKSIPLKLPLAISVIAGCTVAPSESTDPTAPEMTVDELGTTIPSTFFTRPAGAPVTDYVSVPGGLQVHKSCVQLLKPGETQVKKPPCPYPPIKGKTIKKTMPVEPNTLVASTPAPSFDEVPSSWAAAALTEYHAGVNTGWRSEYNVTKFTESFGLPFGPTGGDQGQLIYIFGGVQKWGGNYPYLTSCTAIAGAFFQIGWNGMWGSWKWAMFTYAANQIDGNWTFNGPIYDPPQGTHTIQGSSQHVSDPYWGSVTRWHLTIDGYALPLDVNFPDPWDFNFAGHTLEWLNGWGSPAQAVNLYPNVGNLPWGGGAIGWTTHFYVQPHGCTPNDEDYGGVPAWQCVDTQASPVWDVGLGNGGTMPDYYWLTTKQSPPRVGAPYSTEFYEFKR